MTFFMIHKGIRVVGKNEKMKSLKLESLKLEIFAEVGEAQAKLERTERTLSLFWTVHFGPDSAATTFQVHSNFPTSARTFQLQKKLSNFAWFVLTLLGSFQLRSVLSNFSQTFQIQIFQL